MSTTPKDIESMSLAELEVIVAQKKRTEIDVLHTEIKALSKTLAEKQDALEKLTVEPATPKVKRGRKKGSKNKAANFLKAINKGTRDTGLKDKILKFVQSKGSAGVHVNEIVKHTGKPKVNINAFLATTGKKAGIQGKGNRSGIYFLK